MTTPDRQLGAELARIEAATGDAVLAEVRAVLRRRAVWPVGPSRPGRRHSRDTMLVTGRSAGHIRIRNRQRHALLLEHREVLRRRRNRHAGGLLRALTRLWPRIMRRAAARAAR